jgi:AcrR family transcriptional regulator
MPDAQVTARRAARTTADAKPRRGPKPAFTPDDILRCALGILDAKGHEALTFRAVAAALGTSHQALYNYFPSRADLEDAIAARLIADVRPLSPARAEPLREQLVQFALDLIHTFSLHPYLRQISGPACAAISGRLHSENLRVLVAAGIDGGRAYGCQLVLQFVAAGQGVELHRARRTPKATWRKMAVAYSQQLTQGLPASVLRALAATDPQARVRSTIEMIIDAFLPELERASGRR